MANFEFIDQEASIVLVGSFNPAIFHPEWFVRHEIIPEVDGEGAEIEIVHPEVAKFSFPWVNIDVLINRFIARAKDPAHFSPLRDLVISTFSILEHSPVTQLGMNLTVNYSIADVDLWHKIGDVLAPKDIWAKSLPDRVGLRSLGVSSPRTDDLDGKINVKIEARPNLGVNIEVNSHINLDKDSSLDEILSVYWAKSIEEGRLITDTTINEALK